MHRGDTRSVSAPGALLRGLCVPAVAWAVGAGQPPPQIVPCLSLLRVYPAAPTTQPPPFPPSLHARPEASSHHLVGLYEGLSWAAGPALAESAGVRGDPLSLHMGGAMGAPILAGQRRLVASNHVPEVNHEIIQPDANAGKTALNHTQRSGFTAVTSRGSDPRTPGGHGCHWRSTARGFTAAVSRQRRRCA